MGSRAGLLLQRAADLDAALKGGFTIGLDEVNVEDFSAWRVLTDEAERYSEEKRRAANIPRGN